MPPEDPEELTIVASYPDRMLLVAWRPDQPGVRVIIAGATDPDDVVTLEQNADTDELLRRLRRLVLRLPGEGR